MLKVLIWNLQDFFVFMDKYQNEDLKVLTEPKWQLLTNSFKTNKPLKDILAIAELVQHIKPDILLLTEVGGLESIENFNQYFLQDQYRVIHSKSNSERGIDLAALVRPDLECKFKLHTNKVFARGLLEVNLEINKTHLCFLHTHLKSKLNLRGNDFEGRDQRKKEVLAIGKIIKKKQALPHIHPIVTGDLNGIISQENTEPELADFAHIYGLYDAFELLNLPHFERWSYLYYNSHSDAVFMQLDYCLMEKELAKHLHSETKVLNFLGETRTIFPLNRAEKNHHPSDHYPLLIAFDFA